MLNTHLSKKFKQTVARRKGICKPHTTIVTPANQRGRSVSLTLELATKESQTVTSPIPDQYYDRTTTIEFNKKEKKNIILTITWSNHKETYTKSKKVSGRQLRYTQILSTPVIWFLCLRNSLVISEYLKDNGSARILLSADVSKLS